MNERDNETKILVANINAQSKLDGIQDPEFTEESKANLYEKIREFDERLKLDREKLALEEQKAKMDASIRKQSLNKKNNSSNK